MREIVEKAKYEEYYKNIILKSFEPLLKKCIKSYLNDFSYYEDALQEGRICILKCIENYDIDSNVPFEGYAKVAVINCIRNFSGKIKKDWISLEENVTEDGKMLHEIIASSLDLEGESIKNDECNRLYKAIGKLSKKQREVIEDYYFSKKKMVEIAKMKRCHYMAVVRLKDRAIEKLRKELK